MALALLSQLGTLFWKQRVNIRADLTSALAVLLLPSILLLLSSTNSGNSATSNSLDLVECRIDNFLYCNYPMDVAVDSDFSEEFYSDSNSVLTTFQTAASNLAKELGSDYDSLFPEGGTTSSDQTLKSGGLVQLKNSTLSTVTWYNGENNVFAENFISTFNKELSTLNSDIQFKEAANPFAYEGGSSSFDLRLGSFLLLIQMIGNHITNEKSTNMYYYMNRVGMLPSAFWIFQYLYWMLISSVSIGIAAITGAFVGREIQVGAYFISAWFHVAIAALLGSIFKNKKFVNMSTFFLLILGFAAPIIFASIKQNELNKKIYDGFLCLPIYFVTGNTTSYQMGVGSFISAGCMLLGAYLAPLLTVSEGMYAGSKVNYLYFLSPKFWKEGIVALPSHQDIIASTSQVLHDDVFDINGNGSNQHGLVFQDCVKQFGKDKVIGPMNLKLETGNITTLLGPNGVGKSTFMRVAAGYYIPSAGEMIFGGINTFRECPWSCLKSISFCPQDNYIYEYMTVEEHMLLVSSFRDMSRIDGGDVLSHINWILTTLDILQKRSTIAKNLSGGMKRRLCLAMSIVGFPKVILCDEPSSGVDSISQRGIWKLLETAKKKSAVLLTSHSSIEAVILSDSVVMMKSSDDIVQTNGTQKMAFSVKDIQENTTTEYDVNSDNSDEVANIVASLPNDGSEWKVASKRLTSEVLPPLEDYLKQLEEKAAVSQEDQLQSANAIPETLECGTPNTWRQIVVLMSIMLLHVDRVFFLVVFALPINGGQIWLAYSFSDFGYIVKLILTPLVPLITIICSAIIVVQMTEIFATERSLGITKLLFSAGISRFAYLASYIFLYSLMSFPVSVALLITVGSIHGTPAGIVAVFFLFLSFFFLLLGVCVLFGSILDVKTAFIMTLILPSFFAIFSQGAMSKTFANMYPGSVGQVIAGLLIDNVNSIEWILYAVSFIINILIGLFSFYVFMVKMTNYNPLSMLRGKKDSQRDLSEDRETPDVENNGNAGNDIFLEGESIIKIYGVGEKDNLSFRALDDVTFSVPNGSLLGLVGKSGSGKSTLMDILAGQLNVTSGAVFVEGKRVLPAVISKVVSMCGQLDTIWPDMKVINAIMIFMKCRGYHVNSLANKISDPYVAYLINELGMEEMLKKKVKTLSGGQKRRLAFLVSLIGDTKVVLVDEAMTGIDIETRKIMWKILQDEVRLRDRSVVVTSHEMSEIEQYCNTVGILHDGKLVEMGRLDHIKKKWGDSVKLICSFSSIESVSGVEKIIVQDHSEILVKSPHVDVLDEPDQTRVIATYAIDLIDLKNIAGLIRTMDDLNDSSLLFWSIEPQSLDDFVRSKSSNSNTLS